LEAVEFSKRFDRVVVLCFSTKGDLPMCVSRVVKIVLVSIICAMANTAPAALIAYYGLNETDPLKGKTAADSSGNGFNGTYSSAGTGPTSIASVNAGLYGTAVHLNSTAGNTDYVNIPTLNGLTQTGAFTYAAWINPDSTQLASPTIIGNLNSNLRGYDLRIVPSGTNWNLRLTSPSGTITSVTGSTIIPSGVWTHVAVTKDANGSGGTDLSNVQFYVNGSPVDSGTIGLTGATAAVNYFIGAGRSGTQYYGGGVDEVRIYNEVLDATAIAGLAAVPEPTGLFLMLSSIVGALVIRRRRDM
jgi:hypothetical protein